ncbi:helix-turn-helix domain-containing protein [Paenibacillus sp.]|uniref:helix-turn-helix domain-containing protein n=1 Tax=Paenibacillus sp. TaxID=58172 RepID=UPI003565FA6C
MDTQKQKHLLEKIDHHLRKTARRMVQFDTLDETLHYLIDSFHEQFACNYMAIIIKDGHTLKIKAKKGEAPQFEQHFPLSSEACLPRVYGEPLCTFDLIKEEDNCSLLSGLNAEQFQTWFTFPIRQENEDSLGLCVIGFRSFVPLVLGAEKLFEEYGKDIAIAFALGQQKETELKKIKGLEWLKENVYLGGSSLEEIVSKIVERAGKGTNAESAFIYLYDEDTNCFLYQPPSYGINIPQDKIDLKEAYDLNPFFAFLEKPGGGEITIPLIINLKTIGVLHVINKEHALFTADDLELLQFLASHVSALIENARLYSSEKDRKYRLETFMHHQQELVKHTLEDDGFSKISEFLSDMMKCSVFLFDRFFHLTSSCILESDPAMGERILSQVKNERRHFQQSKQLEYWITVNDQLEFGMFKVVGAGDLLGYLGLAIPRKKLDTVLKMTLNHALNVYAVQFIKQKVVLDVREQVKDSFFNQLFVEEIHNKGKILEYANLLNWNILEPHVIGLFSFVFEEKGEQKSNLLEVDAQKTWIWDRIRDHVSRSEPGIILTRKDEYYVTIVPQAKATGAFWKTFYERIKKIISSEFDHVASYLGISQEAHKIEDYYNCYKQAQKTLAILYNRFPDKQFLSFHQLGSYTVLYNLADPHIVPLFLRAYLDPLLQYGNGKNRDLFNTLRVYLQTNGNIKDSSDRLFIHRSSFKYRLEKIREILQVDIDDAEQRFNIMLAYKLYDLHLTESSDA